MTQVITIVNASMVLRDNVVRNSIRAYQKQIDRDFLPVWGKYFSETSYRLEFVSSDVIFHTLSSQWPIKKDSWPIFINRHSTDPGVLGWHDDDIKQNFPIHGRVFAGDCVLHELNWQVTLGHEILETIADPSIERVWRMPGPGKRFAAFEVCDAVESDDQAYLIYGQSMTNFVYPSYFSTDTQALLQYDHLKKLHAPCPSLTPGGYMSLQIDGKWTKVMADKANGLVGRRAIARTFRRTAREDKTNLQEVVI